MSDFPEYDVGIAGHRDSLEQRSIFPHLTSKLTYFLCSSSQACLPGISAVTEIAVHPTPSLQHWHLRNAASPEVSFHSSLCDSLYPPSMLAPGTPGYACEFGFISTYQLRKMRYRVVKGIKRRKQKQWAFNLNPRLWSLVLVSVWLLLTESTLCTLAQGLIWGVKGLYILSFQSLEIFMASG